MDDVAFDHNGRDAETWRLHREATAISGVAISGRNVMSINACSDKHCMLCDAEPQSCCYCYIGYILTMFNTQLQLYFTCTLSNHFSLSECLVIQA